MSVVIAPTLSKLTQVTATGDETSTVTDGDTTENVSDFATFLQGQLTLLIPTTSSRTTKEGDSTASQPNSESAAPIDATLLLATMGFIPPETRQNPDNVSTSEPSQSNIGKTGNIDLNSLTVLQPAISGQDFKPEDKTERALLEAGALPAESAPAIIAVVSPAPSESNLESIAKKNSFLSTPFASPDIISTPKNILAASAAIAPNTSLETSENLLDNTTNNLSTFTATVPSHNSTLPINHEISLSISTPIHDRNWVSDFGQKIVWLTENDKQAAQLTLNPPHMGPIEISLTLDKGSATASFSSANADVRQTIEMALPRLREMFASAGIELGQTNVSSQSFGQQTGNRQENRSSSQWRANNDILAATPLDSLPVKAFAAQKGNGLVDLFA